MTAPSQAHGPDRKLTEEEISDLRERVKAFMAEHIYPNEPFFHKHHPRRSAEGAAKLKELQAKTKALGMWAPHLPSAAGGMGIGFMPYVYMNEILGRSTVAPMAFGSQAPDSGNAEILWQFGTKELQDKYM
ncbi:MAG: acyl-CoA dehydrogenase family protein, partial [Dehalococcoidia bacterium]|nr:acyl-CoA dehydrogenase family protein [Dehalococcoidia bacterium]